MSKKTYSRNDQRSIVMNPTSKAYAADQANRARQAAESAAIADTGTPAETAAPAETATSPTRSSTDGGGE